MPIGMQITDRHFVYHNAGGDSIHFEISDEKAKAGDATIYYYGYISGSGSWIIMENDTDEGTYRYKIGSSLYAANWAARESLTYVFYNAINA